jgi:hypothetical protein
MWPNYYYLEARRLAAERTVDAELAELVREAALYRQAHPSTDRHPLRRAAARLAMTAGRASVRLARVLDECAVGEGAGSPSGATRLG